MALIRAVKTGELGDAVFGATQPLSGEGESRARTNASKMKFTRERALVYANDAARDLMAGKAQPNANPVQIARDLVAGKPPPAPTPQRARPPRFSRPSIPSEDTLLPAFKSIQCLKCAGFINFSKDGEAKGTTFMRAMGWDVDDIRYFFSRVSDIPTDFMSRDLLKKTCLKTMAKKQKFISPNRSGKAKEMQGFKNRRLKFPVPNEDRPRRFQKGVPLNFKWSCIRKGGCAGDVLPKEEWLKAGFAPSEMKPTLKKEQQEKKKNEKEKKKERLRAKGDWRCPSCGAFCFRSSKWCSHCGQQGE
mmetsp:Transcript_54621/g.124398  ORF Transcript_54621/g.124398 Transcript_54621/m.124398 type:complete len:303 (+) Transcript_54621:577-1485(+)